MCAVALCDTLHLLSVTFVYVLWTHVTLYILCLSPVHMCCGTGHPAHRQSQVVWLDPVMTRAYRRTR